MVPGASGLGAGVRSPVVVGNDEVDVGLGLVNVTDGVEIGYPVYVPMSPTGCTQ